MGNGLEILLLLIVFYAVVAVWLGRRSITMPMFFLAIGAITGADGLGWINISPGAETVKILCEITLALLLFADSSTLNLHQLKDDAGLPTRLLAIALPLIIFLGGLVAFALFPQEGLRICLADWGDPGADGCRIRPANFYQPARPGAHPPRSKCRERAQ